MTEKQIKNKIDKFNKKLTKQIEKFVDNVEKTSMEFKDLFPTMSEEELKGKIILFKQILEKCLLSFETDYDEIVSGVIDSKSALKNESSVQKVSESEQSSQSVQSTQSEKSETQETKPRKIEIINIK